MSLLSFDTGIVTMYSSSLRFAGFRFPSISTLSCTAKEFAANPIAAKLRMLKIINF